MKTTLALLMASTLSTPDLWVVSKVEKVGRRHEHTIISLDGRDTSWLYLHGSLEQGDTLDLNLLNK